MLGNESSMLILMLGTKVPENKSSKERKLHLRNFLSGNKKFWVRKVQLLSWLPACIWHLACIRDPAFISISNLYLQKPN